MYHPKIKLEKFDNLKLDLGCGNKPREGYIGLDYSDEGQEIVWDADKMGIPLSDNSVSKLYSNHALEHFENIFFIIDEIWRVTKPDGEVEIIVPWREHPNTWRHPDHKQFGFAPDYWQWWSEGNKNNDRESYGVKAKFKLIINRVQDKTHSLVIMKPVK